MTQELPLMRKATAVWLVENTSLTFDQIADFCGLHELEVQGIADGDIGAGIMGQDPVNAGQLTREEISRCEKDSKAKLVLKESASEIIRASYKKKTGKYTPIARRTDKPDGILYLLKYYPEITNAKVKKLIGTTDKMIESIRNRTHWNMKNLKPRDIVLLGLCSQSQFNDIVLQVKEYVEEEVVKKSVKKAVKKVAEKKVVEKKATAKKPAAKKTAKK